MHLRRGFSAKILRDDCAQVCWSLNYIQYKLIESLLAKIQVICFSSRIHCQIYCLIHFHPLESSLEDPEMDLPNLSHISVKKTLALYKAVIMSLKANQRLWIWLDWQQTKVKNFIPSFPFLMDLHLTVILKVNHYVIW